MKMGILFVSELLRKMNLDNYQYALQNSKSSDTQRSHPHKVPDGISTHLLTNVHIILINGILIEIPF